VYTRSRAGRQNKPPRSPRTISPREHIAIHQRRLISRNYIIYCRIYFERYYRYVRIITSDSYA